MCSLKEHNENIRGDNEKLLKEKDNQEEINKMVLRNLIEKKQNKKLGQTSTNDGQGNPREEYHKQNVQEILNEDSESLES